MSDRPTPETNALDHELHSPCVLQDRYSEMRDHARKMERERDEALAKYAAEATDHMLAVNKLCNERDEALAERDRYKRQWEESRTENVEAVK